MIPFDRHLEVFGLAVALAALPASLAATETGPDARAAALRSKHALVERYLSAVEEEILSLDLELDGLQAAGWREALRHQATREEAGFAGFSVELWRQARNGPITTLHLRCNVLLPGQPPSTAIGPHVQLEMPGDDLRFDWTLVTRSEALDRELQRIVTEAARELRWLYWRRPRALGRARLDGSDPQVLFEGRSYLAGPVVDEAGRIYWAEREPGYEGTTCVIRRSAADGTRAGDVIVDVPIVETMTLHRGRLYWTDGSGRIRSARNDGTDPRDVAAEGVDFARHLVAAGDLLYWVDFEGERILRIDAGSRIVEDFLPRLDTPVHQAMELEPVARPSGLAAAGGRLYFTVAFDGTIRSSRTDGSRGATLLSGLEFPRSLASHDGQLVWTEGGRIRRVGVGGGDPEDIVAGLSEPVSPTVAAGKLYWVDRVERRIQRSDLGGGRVETLVEGDALFGPSFRPKTRADRPADRNAPEVSGVAVAGGRLFWIEAKGQRILRADLSGSDVQDLLLGVSFPNALVERGGWLYWTEGLTDKVRRVRLDGSRVEDLFEEDGAFPTALAVTGGRVYWIEADGAVRSMDAGGGKVAEVIPAPPDPQAELLDEIVAAAAEGRQLYRVVDGLASADGWIYWSDVYNGKVQRAPSGGPRLDPSRIEDVVTSGLEIDSRVAGAVAADADAVYWSAVEGVWWAPLDRPDERRRVVEGDGVHALVVP